MTDRKGGGSGLALRVYTGYGKSNRFDALLCGRVIFARATEGKARESLSAVLERPSKVVLRGRSRDAGRIFARSQKCGPNSVGGAILISKIILININENSIIF